MFAWIQLLISFLKIGLLCIGGGYATLPLIEAEVVSKHHWMSVQEYMDIITISQMTPGPLAVNAATFTGMRIGGLLGAVMATIGCVSAGFVFSVLLYKFFNKNRQSAPVASVLGGLRAASTGLIASAGGTMILMALFHRTELSAGISFEEMAALMPDLDFFAAGVFVVCVIVLRKWKPGTIPVIIATGLLGIVRVAAGQIL